MSIACKIPLFSSHILITTSKHPKLSYPFLTPSSDIEYKTNIDKRVDVLIPQVASIPYQPINVDYLKEEFSGHGVTFESIGESCVAKLGLENGSTAILMLPSGLITSYKVPMWHGGMVELLHTLVSEKVKSTNEVDIEGGVSLSFNFIGDNQVSWSPSNWALRNIRGNSKKSIQVELICKDSEDMVEVKYIVTLKEDVLSSELVITNSKSSPIQLSGTLLNHLAVSSPEATFAVGLDGSDFFTRSPFLSSFGIIPSDFGLKKGIGFSQLWNQVSLLSSTNTQNESECDEDIKGEETDNYKQLGEEMSLLYTNSPRNFTIIDRGRRSSVIVVREGFDELYMLSPGSSYELFGKYAYICVGQSAMLKPLVVFPGDVWRGVQHLHNPNL